MYLIHLYVIEFVSELLQVSSVLYTFLYIFMLKNLSVNCGRSEVYIIQFDMIEFVSELWQVRGVLDAI